jgi:hypothetical protein
LPDLKLLQQQIESFIQGRVTTDKKGAEDEYMNLIQPLMDSEVMKHFDRLCKTQMFIIALMPAEDMVKAIKMTLITGILIGVQVNQVTDKTKVN